MATLDQPSTQARWKVRYYDRQKGGVWSATFFDADKAARFAVGKVLYGKPAKVEPVTAKAVA